MKLVVLTHVPHNKCNNTFYAYAPYVKEMNIWEKYCDELIIVAPFSLSNKTVIDSAYFHSKLTFIPVSNFDLLSIKSTFSFLFKLPKLLLTIFKAMQQADHIHLRCPGNIGLLACLVQILFPSKIKTAKYAGNWDPKAKQPWSYVLQKKILNNTFLTKNMTVLAYGEWDGSSKNIKPFFTATYSELEKEPIAVLDFYPQINFVFVGTLVVGKNPLYAIQVVEKLRNKGYAVYLDLYGDGVLRVDLEKYISTHNLEQIIKIHGNQSKEIVTQAYQKSHFVILPSKSEGWPKAIAEGMFWGAVPLATRISCVPFMLNKGERGVLLTMNLDKDINQVEQLLLNKEDYYVFRNLASDWSRKYTIGFFENEIKKLLL